MVDKLINFKTAKLAKEKKFDVPCIYSYEWHLMEDWNNSTEEERDINTYKHA